MKNRTVGKIVPKLIKILVIVKNIDGGIGTFLIDLLKIQRKSQIKIKIISLERPTYRKGGIPGIKFIRPKDFYPSKISLSPLNLINSLHDLIVIKREIKTFGPEIVMGIDLRCNFLSIASKLFSSSNAKIIAATHIDLASLTLNNSSGIIKYLLKTSIHFFYERADALISVSKNLSSHLKRDFDIHKIIKTIYNGQDFKVGRKRKFPDRDKKIIVSVARLSLQKDHKNLIKGVSLLDREYENYELWIVGDGPEKINLIRFVNDLGLTNKVKFLGWVKNVNKILDKSHIFVLSSKSEGFGYVLIEAMSRGLPIISTDTPYGPSEILDKGKYGLLVPMGRGKMLEKAMLQMATNKLRYEYFSAQSLKRSKFFSREKMLSAYQKIFTELAIK